MNNVIIAQSSLTYAYHGRDILSMAGIPCSIVRLSEGSTRRGCGYGLSLPSAQLNRALSLLHEKNAFVGEVLHMGK